jgi:hypothetical protein
MANPWFRMYAEFAHDPKVQMLSEAMQRRYLMLMCMRCSNTLVTLQETEVAFHLRITDEELAETKALFVSKGFIDEAWNLLHWEKRQFVSDTSNARVAKHRALQKQKQQEAGNRGVTLPKREANGLDTDTDTDKKRARDPAPVIPGVSPQLLSDYLEVRKGKRAGKITPTVIAALEREAGKAGIDVADAVKACCEFGWQGFNAGWYAERVAKGGGGADPYGLKGAL